MIGDKHDEMEGLQFHCYIDIAIHRASNAFPGALNDDRHMKRRKKYIRRRTSDQRFRIWIRLILLAKTLEEAPSVSPNFAQMSYLTHSNLDFMYAVGVSVPSLCSERRHYAVIARPQPGPLFSAMSTSTSIIDLSQWLAKQPLDTMTTVIRFHTHRAYCLSARPTWQTET